MIAEQELERDPDDEDAAQTRDVPALQKVDKKVLFSEDYSAPKNFTTITIPMVKFLERDDGRFGLCCYHVARLLTRLQSDLL